MIFPKVTQPPNGEVGQSCALLTQLLCVCELSQSVLCWLAAAQLVGYSQLGFERPSPLYSAVLFSGHTHTVVSDKFPIPLARQETSRENRWP